MVTACLAGCGGADHPARDAGPGEMDAATCQPTTLLLGGMDVTQQGWSVVMQPPASLTYTANETRLSTSTSAGATSGGQLLLGRSGALDTGKPFRLQVMMLVESVTPHNQLDSAAAILGSFTPPAGTQGERQQMIYLDADRIGWADGAQSFAATIAGSAYHTYELSVDAAGAARVSIDGQPALTRAGFSTSGTIAIGDQTNDKGVDSALRIATVTRLCP